MKILTVANHKGGVGKTTSAINIGAGLNKLGKRVLLLDLDSQANLSWSLGITEPSATIYSALRGGPLQPIHIRKGLELIPSTLDLSGWELEVSSRTGRELILRDLLHSIGDSYEFIIIDPPPSLGLLTVNALTASRVVLIPLQAQYLALQGFSKLLEVIEMIRERLNPDLRVGGVFITQYDRRKILHRNVVDSLEAHFTDKLFTTRIRDNVALAEAPTQGLNIYDYAPHSYGAEDYLNLCKEILKNKTIKTG